MSSRSNSALFCHFHLLAQLVADALQPFPHAASSMPASRGEPRDGPASVIPPVAELAFLGRQRQQGAGEPLPLLLGPARFRLVEDRYFWHVVQPQKRPAA